MKTLRPVGITSLHLMAFRCPCGELNVLGFWHQVPKAVCVPERKALVYQKCDRCDRQSTRVVRLTTGRHRPRFFNWTLWGIIVACWLPDRWVRVWLQVPIKLERWFPL